MPATVPTRPEVDPPPLAIRPARSTFVAEPDAAALVVHPLLDDRRPTRSTLDDLDRGWYRAVPVGSVPVYRITVSGRAQTGLILEAAVTDYTHGRILPHEATRPHAVGALADHLETAAVDVAPVTLTYDPDEELEARLAAICRTDARSSFRLPDGTHHEIWLPDAELTAPIVERLRSRPALYVVDGHHRCAAGALLATRAIRHGSGEAAEQLFAFVVAQDQLAAASFHLLVSGVTDATAEVVAAVAAKLGTDAVDVEVGEVAGLPPGTIAMWCAGRWYRFATAEPAPLGDVEIVHTALLGPVFGIEAPEDDPRLAHVPGTVDPQELQQRCPASTVAFVVHPPSVSALFAAADTGRAVPPKSSYFHPKMPAGLFVRSRG
jgi:uncharacterized protein (DUF1015 family)